MTALEWNAYGKVRQVTTSTATMTFGYDAQQNRLKKTVATSSGTKTTYYIRDAQGNALAVYEQNGASLIWKEQDLYGSSRLGMAKPEREVTGFFWASAAYTLVAGAKSYELSNHLGNVMAVISDRGELQSATDYFPFGMAMPGRSTPEKHRYGFNGKETDPETGLNDFGARLYDNRLGRWLTTDPLEKKFPMWSSYVAMNDNPIVLIDPKGKSAEPPINFFGSAEPANFHAAVKAFKFKEGDGKFFVFGHANPYGIDCQSLWIETPKMFNEIMTGTSKEWAKAMKEGKPITLTFYSCNIGANQYQDRETGSLIKESKNFAQQISEAFPNVKVIAPNGYCWYNGDDKDKPGIAGISNALEEGGFVTFVKGKKVAFNAQAYVDSKAVRTIPQNSVQKDKLKPKKVSKVKTKGKHEKK